MKRIVFVSIVLTMAFAISAHAAMTCAHLRMDAEHNALKENTRVIAWAMTGAANQHFNFDPERGVVSLENTQLCIAAEQLAEGSEFSLQTCEPNSPRQALVADEVDRSLRGVASYRVKLKELPQYCVDVKAAADGNPALVILWTCHGGTNQRWFVERDGAQDPGRP